MHTVNWNKLQLEIKIIQLWVDCRHGDRTQYPLAWEALLGLQYIKHCELALERVEYLPTSKVDLDTETLYITNAYHIPFTHQSPPLQSRPLSTTIS